MQGGRIPYRFALCNEAGRVVLSRFLAYGAHRNAELRIRASDIVQALGVFRRRWHGTVAAARAILLDRGLITISDVGAPWEKWTATEEGLSLDLPSEILAGARERLGLSHPVPRSYESASSQPECVRGASGPDAPRSKRRDRPCKRLIVRGFSWHLAPPSRYRGLPRPVQRCEPGPGRAGGRAMKRLFVVAGGADGWRRDWRPRRGHTLPATGGGGSAAGENDDMNGDSSR